MQYLRSFSVNSVGTNNYFVAGAGGVVRKHVISFWKGVPRFVMWRNVTEGRGSHFHPKIAWRHLWMSPLYLFSN